MSTWEKLIKRIISLDRNLRFEEVRKILEGYGYTVSGPGRGSSHRTFRKAGCMPITIPMHDPVKTVYVMMVKEIIEREAIDGEEDI